MNKAEAEILENYLKDAKYCEALDNKKYGRLFQLTDEEDLHLLIELLEAENEDIPEESISDLFSDYKDFMLDRKYSWDVYFDLFMGFPYEQQYDLRDYDISRNLLDDIAKSLHEDRVFDNVINHADNSDIPYIMSISARIVENDDLIIYCYVISETGEDLVELKRALPTYKYFKGIPYVGYGYNESAIKKIIEAVFTKVGRYLG